MSLHPHLSHSDRMLCGRELGGGVHENIPPARGSPDLDFQDGTDGDI